MNKSIIWKLAVIILLILLAVFLSLDIQYPDWVKGLMSWRAEGQQEIALSYGLDLSDGIQVVLAVKTVDGQTPSAEMLESTRRIIENRARRLTTGEATAQIVDGRIVVRITGIQDVNLISTTLSAEGLVEFVDAGYDLPDTGSLVETSLGPPDVTLTPVPPTPTPLATPTQPVTPTTAISPTATVSSTAVVSPTATVSPTTDISPTATLTPTTALTPTQPVTTTPAPPPVLTTILNNINLTSIKLVPTADGYLLESEFTPEAWQILAYQIQLRQQLLLCATLDKEVIGCQFFTVEGGRNFPVPLSEEKAAYISTMFRYAPLGSLPLPLRVENVETIGPALSKSTVERSGTIALIAFVAALLILPAHYRLPGLLADLALLLFALFALAACRTIPIPINPASVTALSIAALLAIGGTLITLERLREELRGLREKQLPTKAMEIALSRPLPAIRDTHIATLLLSIAAWYIGFKGEASAVYWMGMALTAGTLISFFVTAFVTPTLVRLLFNAVPASTIQEWLSERKALLGI